MSEFWVGFNIENLVRITLVAQEGGGGSLGIHIDWCITGIVNLTSQTGKPT